MAIPAPPARPTPDQLRRQVASLVAGTDCAALDGGVSDDGRVTLGGALGRPAIDGLRRGLADIVPAAQTQFTASAVEPSYCEALSVVRAAGPGFGAPGVRLGLQLLDGRTRLVDGDVIRPVVTMPDFAGQLNVSYLSHDGTVEHIFPRLAEPSQRWRAEPPRQFAARERVNLLEPGPERARFAVGDPFGTDLIIAVASSAPLLPQPRRANGEQAEAYLRDLREAIEAARRRGVRVAAEVLVLETAPN